jgi:putative ABC transport system permease protein
VERTTLIRDGLRGPVLPIALGGSLLALLLVAAAGSYWADRRGREVRLLSARGVGPAALALKALLELALPALAGTVVGWLLARWLVGLVGPSPVLDASAPVRSGLTAAATLVAGLAALALVAGVRSRAATERPVGAARSWAALVPWELLLLAGALVCWLRLRDGAAVTLADGIAQINLLVVAFPLLLIVGGSVLVVRLLALALPRLGRRAGRLPAALYLAARRITAAPVATMVLLAAASTPVAMVVYAAGLTTTSDHTLDAKAQLLTGSNVSLQSVDPVERTPATDAIGTVVVRYLFGKVDGQNDDVAVLAIDPDTFPATAFWDRRFAGVPLAELMDRLRAPAAAGVVPAVVLPDGPAFPAGFDVRLGTTTVRVADVGTARWFPGRRLRQPMLVVDRSRLPAVDAHAGSVGELWTRGTVEPARAALAAQDARVFFDPKDRDSTFEVANFVGVSWTFGYLTALAALVGSVAIGGLLLYLETRQRSRLASYVLGGRMGLTRRLHRRSLLAELAVLLGLAWVTGAALAWVAVLLVYGRLDLDPVRPPGPLLTVPTGAILGSLAAAAVVAVLAALYAQRSADRADVATVLRLDS